MKRHYRLKTLPDGRVMINWLLIVSLLLPSLLVSTFTPVQATAESARSLPVRLKSLNTLNTPEPQTIVIPPPTVPISSLPGDVVPIDWSTFTGGNPTDPDSIRLRNILLNANRCALTVWYDAKGFGTQTSPYLDFGGNGHDEIRGPAHEALSLAISIKTGIYNPASVGGVSLEEAKAKTIRLLTSLAYHHKVNQTGGWGDSSQSAFWAYQAGLAGWLMWDELSSADQAYVRNMVEYEADRFIGYVVPYYRDTSGTIIYPGDTKAEENAWNAQILQLATAMMPHHANWNLWLSKSLELLISATARPVDVNRMDVLHGRPLAMWLNGSNYADDGTVVNHGIIHPDYMAATPGSSSQGGLVYTLAGMSTPRATFFNADVVYQALVDLNFPTPPYHPPGGTIYVDGSGDLYYPEGTDWGARHTVPNAALLDIFADAFGFDHLVSREGAYWQFLHTGLILDMQNRHADGHTFANDLEDFFPLREEQVAALMGLAYLTKWIMNQPGAFSITDEAYFGIEPPVTNSSRFVATNGTDSNNDCTNSATPCAEVQHAVDVAEPGNEIRVAAGTYTGVSARAGITQVVYISRTITIRGGYTTTNWLTPYPITQSTTLDAQGQGRVLYVASNSRPTVEGLRITGGNAAGLYGGGIYIAGATAIISNCTIVSNTARYGGGLYVDHSAATLKANIIGANTASSGGGLYLSRSAAVVNANTITTNTAQYGSGLYLSYSPATLNGNSITANMTEYDGGGVRLSYSSATLNANTITTNTARCGGGLYLYSSQATLRANTISANTAHYRGGGLYLRDNSDAMLENNFVTDNMLTGEGSGSGSYVSASNPQFRHLTIARNTGGGGEGLYVRDGGGIPALVQLRNTVLVSQAVGIRVVDNSSADLEGTLWGAGVWANDVDWDNMGTGSITTGTINVWGNPAFVDCAALDYHLTAASAAKDAGVYAALDDDIDGEPRPMGFGPDIGADELPASGPLQLSNTTGQRVVNPGQAITYTLAVTANGGAAFTNVILTDTLPAQQRVVSAVSDRGSCILGDGWGGSIICTLGTMNVDETALVTLTAQVTTVLPVQLPYSMRNTAIVLADQASNVVHLDITLQNCHVRLNENPTEWDNIQAAVDVSTQPTDVIKVAGICAGINTLGRAPQVVNINKTVTIRGGYTTAFTEPPAPDVNPTILDAQGQGRVLSITGVNITPTIEGLHITGGDVTGLSEGSCGNRGGGICVTNVAATINNCTVLSNTAAYGGGLYLNCSPATLNANMIIVNTAAYHGGGLYLYRSSAMLTNNLVADNRANNDRGSGLYIASCSPHLRHTTIARNIGGQGDGLYISDYGTPSQVQLHNTILVSQTVGIRVVNNSSVHLEGTLWGAGAWANGVDWQNLGTGSVITGTVNLWGDPSFANYAARDYHITVASPAKDAGIYPTIDNDIDGDPRPMGFGFDIGADEFRLTLFYLPVILKN